MKSAIIKLFIILHLLISCTVSASVRKYRIAAENDSWNYAPSGQNLIFPDRGLNVWGENLVYKKYCYIGYTDGKYTTKTRQPEWMGILGPQIKAIEGDTLVVHFLNKSDNPLSIHPQGMHYDEKNEGADMKGPGNFFTYRWTVNNETAAGPTAPSSIVWVYHYHVDPVTELYDGLIGTIIITKKGLQRSQTDPRPKDVDTAFTTMFMIFDENGRESTKNVLYKNKHHDSQHHEQEENHDEVEEGNLKHVINGYIFGNLTGLVVKQGQ